MPGDMVAFYFALIRAYRVENSRLYSFNIAKCFQQLCQRDSKHCLELVPGEKFMNKCSPDHFSKLCLRGHIPRPPIYKNIPIFGIAENDINTKKKGNDEDMKKRTYCHWLYLSEEEKAILDVKVKLSGMKNTNIFLRHLIKYGYVYEVDYSELHENNYQLGKIGNNINQIAHIANSTGTISQSEINEVKEQMSKIWQLQESILSKQPYRKQ